MIGLFAVFIDLLVLAGAAATAQAAGTVTRTYSTAGAQQAFLVPAGVEHVTAVAVGGAGGSSGSAAGGLGARVEGELSVTPGTTLYIEVGSNGGRAAHGAGKGGTSSDVRTAPREDGLSPDDRLIVAGAGGGGGAEGTREMAAGAGGNAGSNEGEEGKRTFETWGGGGGTQSEGGSEGESYGEAECPGTEPIYATEGELEVGGRGEYCGTRKSEGGWGGAGYFGGGGAAAGYSGAGGGGGSSLVPAGGSATPARDEAPQVQISYAQPPNPPVLVTGAASEVTRETATVSATVNPEDEEVSSCEFEYGTTEAYESSVPCSPSPGSGVDPVQVSAHIAGLSAATSYHFRVVATNANGSGYGADATFTTAAHNPPVVIASSPEAGPLAGGETVTITGGEFYEVTAVDFGLAWPVTSFTVNSPESITAVSPPSAGTGTVPVFVTTPAGTSPAGGAQFTFLPVPVVRGLSPKKGPATGGTSVVIDGSGFDSDSTVSFGTSPASSVTVYSATSLAAVSPPGAGAVDVTVTTPGGTSAVSKKGRFKYKKVKEKK